MTDATDITHQLGVATAKLAPPAVVTLYAALEHGLPLVISFLTLVYLAYQIAHGFWTWRNEWLRKREIDQQMQGRVAGYNEKAPK